MRDYREGCCPLCGGRNLQVSMPAWCRLDTLEVIQVDEEAEPVYGFFCEDCGDPLDDLKYGDEE